MRMVFTLFAINMSMDMYHHQVSLMLEILLSTEVRKCAVNRVCNSSWTHCTAFNFLMGASSVSGFPANIVTDSHLWRQLWARQVHQQSNPSLEGVIWLYLVNDAFVLQIPGTPTMGRRPAEFRKNTTVTYTHISFLKICIWKE